MSRGTITLDISNATEEAPAKSELLDIGEYKWQVIYLSHESHDGFQLVCNRNYTGSLWLCKAWFSIETKEENSGWKKLGRTASQFWFNSSNKFIPEVKGNGQSQIKVIIEIEWEASKSSSLHPVDASLNMIFNGESSELIVPINKHVLAGNSHYFHNYFFGPLAAVSSGNDANGNPYYDIHEDPNFNHGQFRFMVHTFLCMGTMLERIGDLNWFPNDKEEKIALMRLAVKYHLLEDFAEKQLIKLGSDTMELLELADQFTLAGLKAHCLQTITPNEYCKKLEKNIEIRAGLGPVTRKLLDEKLEEFANKN